MVDICGNVVQHLLLPVCERFHRYPVSFDIVYQTIANEGVIRQEEKSDFCYAGGTIEAGIVY